MSAALELARAGARVVVLEREALVGGPCATHERDGFRFDLAGHRLEGTSPAVDSWIRTLMGDQLLENKPSSVILNGGAQHRYPPELDEVLFRFGLVRGGEELARYLAESIRESSPPVPASTLLDWFAHRFSGSPQRSGSDLYPRQGMGQLLECCAAQISAQGGEVRLGATATGFSIDGRRVRAVRFQDADGGQRELPCRAVISTLALPLLANMLGEVPHEVQWSVRALRFRALRVLNLLLDGTAAVSDHTWMYVSEAKYLTARIHEPNRRSPQMAPAGATSLMLEIPCARDDETWKTPDDRLLDRCLEELRELGLGDLRARVRGHFSTFVREAFPLYHSGYEVDRRRVLDHVVRFEGVMTTGRQGLFHQSSLGSALEMGLSAARVALSLGAPAEVDGPAAGNLRRLGMAR
jgi:protoporphyrinogen oxidase